MIIAWDLLPTRFVDNISCWSLTTRNVEIYNNIWIKYSYILYKSSNATYMAVCGGCHLGLGEIWSQEANLRDNQSFPSWHMCASRSRGTIYHLSCKEASPCLRSSHLPLGKCQHGAFFGKVSNRWEPSIFNQTFGNQFCHGFHLAIAYCGDPRTLIGQCIAKNGL